MNIAQVTPYFLPIEGGLERHVYYISKELIKRGHKVDVLTSDIDRHGNRLPHHEIIDGINIYRFYTRFKLGDFGALWPGFVKKLKDYDIVHVHNYRHPHTVLAAIYCKLKRIPCVITTHSPFHVTNRSFLAKLLVEMYDQFLSRIVDTLFDIIITVNVWEFGYFRRRFPSKTKLIPSSGIDENFIVKNPKTKSGEPLILLIGRIHPSKGILEAIEILHRVRKLLNNVKLFLIGPIEDAAYYKKVKKVVSEYKIEGDVVFLGPVYDEGKKFEYIDKSTLLLVSSPYEAAGLVVIEALAREKPVVARRSPGPESIKELCKCEKCIKLYSTVEEAITYITDLLKDPPDNCSSNIGLFTWKALAKKLEDVYLSLLSDKQDVV